MYEQFSITTPEGLVVKTPENPNPSTEHKLAEELTRNPEDINTQDQNTDNITKPETNEN
jgi:hypothetical protein